MCFGKIIHPGFILVSPEQSFRDQQDPNLDNDNETAYTLFMPSFIRCKVSSTEIATDALGTWTATYNNQGLLATIRNPASQLHLSVTYNVNDQPTSVTDAQNVVTARTFECSDAPLIGARRGWDKIMGMTKSWVLDFCLHGEVDISFGRQHPVETAGRSVTPTTPPATF